MKKVSVGDALAAGFLLIRRKPLAPLAWSAVYLLLFSLPVTAVSLQVMPSLAQASTNPMAGGLGVLKLVLVECVFGLATFAILNAAIFRAILTPEKDGRFYLRLSGEEGRQAVVLAAIGAAMLVATVLLTILLVIAGSIVGGATGIRTPGRGGFIAMIGLMYVLLFAAVGFIGVRLSLSGPFTFAKRRVSLSAPWALTRGNAWRLFGIGAVLTVIGLVYLLLFIALSYALGAGAAGAGLAGAHAGGQAGLDGGRMVITAVLLLVGAAASGYLMPIVTAPWAEAYRQLSEHGVAEVFSDHPGPWRA